MSLPLRIAGRFLSSNKGQTTLIVLGIAIGVAVQVFVGILISSLQSTLIDSTVGGSPHVTVLSATDNATITDWQGIVAVAEGRSDITAVSPAADASVFVIRANRTVPGLLRGFDLDKADGIFHFKKAIYDGRLPASDDEVMIGKDLLEELGLGGGEVLQLFTSSGARSNVTIVGFYDLKVASLNKAWVITTLGTAQKVAGYGGNVTSIVTQVKEIFKADGVAKALDRAISRSDVKVTDWKTENAQLLSGLQGQSVSSYMIQVFVLASVIIAIASVLAIKVLQKSKEIGILKAMGMKDGKAGMVFLYQGLMLGAAGAVTGTLLGVFLLTGFMFGTKNADGSSLININLDWVFISASCLVAIISSALAAALPARATTRLNPIEVIRNG